MRKLALLFLLVPAALSAQSVQDLYTKMEVNIPMRDGVKLFTSIYVPKATDKKAPFLMMRTPYSCRPYGATAFKTSLGPESSFTQEGYIFVYQDVRGRYMSEGDFKWMNPYIPNKKSGQTDEATDTSDTIDWLLKNIPNNNGRLGVYGTSYPGHYAAQCLIDPHPALKAASPQAPMADNWMGDDMHHNGAFFLPHGMNFMNGFDQPRTGPVQNYPNRAFTHRTQDGYQFFLDMGPIANSLTRYNMKQAKIWEQWLIHEDYDEYWQAQNVPQHLKRADKVPTLLVGGWFDAEDLAGPLNIHAAIEKFTPSNLTKIVMGPWYHGSWNGGPGDALHDIKFVAKTGEDFRNTMQKPFFRTHLWQDGTEALPEASMFDTGANQWRTYESWPPKATQTAFYLKSGGKLTSSGEAKSVFDEWISDPAKPVPSSNSISLGMPRQYMLEDQRFAAQRPDVMVYQTPVLEQDLTIVGPVKVDLVVSTSGTDSDFVVKVIDVFPNDFAETSARANSGAIMPGYQMMVRGEPFRAKYRNSWSKPEAMRPNTPEKINMEMPAICHTFKKGHRLMVQIQSSWFPVVGLN
ncbi:MAG: CocE/NonD family hydrolase, partial [Fimbriimonadaceae bacterium]